MSSMNDADIQGVWKLLLSTVFYYAPKPNLPPWALAIMQMKNAALFFHGKERIMLATFCFTLWDGSWEPIPASITDNYDIDLVTVAIVSHCFHNGPI